MSTRYVWQKYNTIFEDTLYPSGGGQSFMRDIDHGYNNILSSTKYLILYYSDSYTTVGTKYKLINPKYKISTRGWAFDIASISDNDIPDGSYIISPNFTYIYTSWPYSNPIDLQEIEDNTIDLEITSDFLLTIPNSYFDGSGGLTLSYYYEDYNDVSSWYLGLSISGKSFNGFRKFSRNKSTLAGDITNSSSTIYPTDGLSGSYWYTYKGSDNIDPTAISYPSVIKGGNSITLTATAGTGNVYGGTITYTYEVQLSGGTWTSIGSTTALTKTYTVPAGTTTFRARVKAKDNMGFASTTYATGNQVTVINNAAPTISGSNSNLGSFSYLSPYIEYVINDVDGNTVSVSIQLDGQSIYSGTAVLGKTEFIVFPDWDSLLNGSHTITITANDGQGGVTTRTYTFSKSVNANLISRERWRRLNEGNVYDVIYFETAAYIVTTNNGKYLRDRINAIRSRVAALKGTSATALAAMDSSIITERLHMKTDSGYNVKYLDTKSQYVKIGSQTVEDILTQIESDIAALKG